MTEKKKIKNIRISKEEHKLAKIRALILDITLKEYIENLIRKDYVEAEKE